MKALIIYNPAAGGKKAVVHKNKLTQALTRTTIVAEWYETKCAGDATVFLTNKDLTAFDAIMCVGGDGTLFEIVNGYMANTSATKPPIGIIPAGTGNSFALEYGLTINHTEEALQIIVDKHISMVDLGFCKTNTDSFYFANIWGLGFVTDVLEIANKWKKTGKMAYNIGVLYNLIFMKNNTLHFTCNGENFDHQNLLVEVSNTKFTGGNYKMAPNANFADGMLDVTLAEKMGRIKLLQLFSKIFEGTHITDKKIKHFQTKEIHIQGDARPLSPDGELRGFLPATVCCVHKILPVFLPQTL